MDQNSFAFDRRAVMRGMGGAALAGLAASPVFGQQAASGLMRRGFADGDMGPPAKIGAHAPFDYNDQMGNWYTTMKITNNLIGERTYIPMFSRVYLGPQYKAGAPLHGHVGLWTWQLTQPDPEKFPGMPEGTVQQNAMMTAMILHPDTFEPVETIYNPYLDKDVEVADSVFAESYLFFPGGGGTSIDRPEFMNDPNSDKSKPPLNAVVRWGDDLSVILTGSFKNDGPNQPRMDSNIWTANYDDLMNPEKHLVEADYNFTGLMRAWERPWIGVSKDDDAQILWNTKGKKVHSVDRFPQIIKDTILKKYPDRV